MCDFTNARTWEGWAYLAIVLDVYSRRTVGWQLAPHMRENLVDDALQMAIADRTNPAGACCTYRKRVAAPGITASGCVMRASSRAAAAPASRWTTRWPKA
jgi:transposase InsO family protein